MPVNHTFKPQPFVKSGKFERMVDPKTLNKQQNRLLWEGIKKDDPELAILLTQDEDLKQLQQQFNAGIRFSVDDVNRYIQTGQQVVEEMQYERINKKS